MNSFIRKYLYNQDKSLEGLKAKRVTVLNFCCFLIIVDVLFFTIKRFFNNTLNLDIFITYLFYLLAFSLIYVLQRRKKYLISKVLFMVFYSITVFALTHFLFAKHNTEYNYLALPVCALLFFDKKWMHYLWLMISILLFFTPYYFIKIRNIDGFVPEEKVFLFVILFLVVKFFRDLSELNERKLEDAYIRLEKTKEYELAYSQLKSLRSQMNPHFIFNALNSIQEYIMLNEKELASVYLIDFSSLMRMYLEHSQRQYISLQEELVSLNLYLRLEKIRFEEEFNYEINVDNKIDKEKIIIPSVFIQPYIENAIKHGLFHKRDNRKLKIQFLLNLDTKVLRCIIHDNGIGRKAAGELKKKNTNYHKSYATKANQKRIDLINLNKERKIKIYVEDLYEKTNSIGTKVCIEIPQ